LSLLVQSNDNLPCFVEDPEKAESVLCRVENVEALVGLSVELGGKKR
jgi:hypothetical protein